MSKDNAVYFDREKNEFVGLDDTLKQDLQKNYLGIDIEKELVKMKRWLNLKGKDINGTIGFIINWLNNAVPSSPLNSTNGFFNFMEGDTPLANSFKTYLEDLWKGKANLFQFNQISR
jgi:hypothetical protein